MEVFSPDTERFIRSLPPMMTMMSPCCMYVDNDMLIVHHHTYVLKFAAGQGGGLVREEPLIPVSPMAEKDQNSQPAVDAFSRVFYVVYQGKCLCFGMDDGQKVGDPV